jgi:hypothetical protein
LSQAESWTEGRKKADGQYAQDVDEENREDGIDKSEIEDWIGQSTNGESRHYHVCRAPLLKIVSLVG